MSDERKCFVMFEKFTIHAKVNQNIHTCFHTYHTPQHIICWNFASEDWHCPNATSEFKEGGRFNYRMEAKDHSFGFDFTGIFDKIEEPKWIKYHMDDHREVVIHFEAQGDQTSIEVTIDAENDNPIALQKRGWQSILNNFKKYAESR